MQRLREIRLVLTGSAIVAAIAFGPFLLLKSLFSNAVVVGPIIAASAAIAVFAGGEYFTRQRIAQQYRWDKISHTYAKFLHLVRRLGSEDPPDNLEEFMAQFSDDLLLWGSPRVITAWIEMLRATERGFTSDVEATELQRDLIRAIRRDLGQGDRKLDDRDLMHLLVHDIDDHFDAGLIPKAGS